MADVGGDLATLKTLHTTFTQKAAAAAETKQAINGSLQSAVWKGNYADKFRSSWEQYSKNLDTLQHALTDAATDVKTNHNNIAAATGMADRI